jgi:hypothetical protein
VLPDESTSLNKEQLAQWSEVRQSTGYKSREAYLPGNHYRVIGRAKISESALKIVSTNMRKWLMRMSQKGTGGRKVVTIIRLRKQYTARSIAGA